LTIESISNRLLSLQRTSNLSMVSSQSEDGPGNIRRRSDANRFRMACRPAGCSVYDRSLTVSRSDCRRHDRRSLDMSLAGVAAIISRHRVHPADRSTYRRGLSDLEVCRIQTILLDTTTTILAVAYVFHTKTLQDHNMYDFHAFLWTI